MLVVGEFDHAFGGVSQDISPVIGCVDACCSVAVLPSSALPWNMTLADRSVLIQRHDEGSQAGIAMTARPVTYEKLPSLGGCISAGGPSLHTHEHTNSNKRREY